MQEFFLPKDCHVIDTEAKKLERNVQNEGSMATQWFYNDKASERFNYAGICAYNYF